MQAAGLAPGLECLLDGTGLSSWNKELVTASQCDGLVDFTAARKAFNEGSGEEPVLDAGLFWALYAGGAECE